MTDTRNDSSGGAPVRLIDTVFPSDANHHGTLFGGVALAHMDKVAFITASRHGREPFVTASSDKIDFAAPARIGELVEATARVTRVGTSSLGIEVELVAEETISGERRLCTRGAFTLVAKKGDGTRPSLPPLPQNPSEDVHGDGIRMVDVVFPQQTSHYGTLYGGDALKMMGKAAFITATRHARDNIVMASSDRIDFRSQIHSGEMIELVARVLMTGRSSMRIGVELWAENLLSADRRQAAASTFTMVAVNGDGRPREISRF